MEEYSAVRDPQVPFNRFFQCVSTVEELGELCSTLNELYTEKTSLTIINTMLYNIWNLKQHISFDSVCACVRIKRNLTMIAGSRYKKCISQFIDSISKRIDVS